MLRKTFSGLKVGFSKFPALMIVIPYILGILSSYFFLIHLLNISFLALWAFQLSISILIIIIYNKARVTSLPFLFLFISLLALGVFRFYSVYKFPEPDDISGKIISMNGKNIKVFGYLIEPPDQDDNRIKFILSADSIVTYNGSTPVNGNVMVSVFKNKYSDVYAQRLNYGDYIQIEGELEPLPHKRNPGEFDYGEYLKLHGIKAAFTSFGFDKINYLHSINPNIFKKNVIYPIKKFTLSSIDRFIGGDEGEFMKGLVLGERSNLSKEIKENFVNDGISHIIAVSGLNVAYVIIIITLFLQLFPLKNTVKILITILVLVFYMNLTGNVPSIVRATIMSGVFLFSLIFERKISSLNVVSFSALIILLVDPRQIFDAGFLLSFWAILSLVFLFPKLMDIVKSFKILYFYRSDDLLKKTISAFLIFIMGTVAAQIGTIPITAIMFKKISLVSFITNMVAIPVSNLAMAMGFLLVLASLVSSWAASAIGITSGFILNVLLKFIDYFAHFNFSFVETYSADYFFLFCFYLIVYFLLFYRKSRPLIRILISLIIILNYFTYKSVFAHNENLNITYLDVGNSNASLINLPDESSYLINSGSSSLKYSSAERNVIPFLKLKGKNKIDVMIITSLNKDEFRNLMYLVSHFGVDRIYARGIYRSLFNDTGFAKTFSGTSVNYVDSPFRFKENPNIRLFLVPDKNCLTSLSVICIYGSQRFIFTDMNSKEFISNLIFANDTKTSVLKVPFSGSFSFTTPEYIAQINPDNVVISAFGKRKKFNSDVFEKSLQGVGIDVFKIKDKGAVIFETDGEKTNKLNGFSCPGKSFQSLIY